MRIQKFLFLLALATIISCNKTVKKDESISLDKKSIAEKKSKISLTIDNEKISDYYFDESKKLVKIEEYLSNGELDREINLEYKKGKFDYAFFGSDKNEKDDWSSNYYSNIELYNDFLITKNIKIDNPFMLSSEVSDIQKLIANIESFQKIKRNNQTIFKSKKLNLNIRFDPSKITIFIPLNSIINNFEYVLDNNGYLIEEAIGFNHGVLTIKYFYKKQKISKIIYSLRYNSGKMLVSNQNYISL
ncbi:hypothetical protein [uncultured Flavobacterium sp.]|uniref:hypothetical protein n=1 Tax=uncultured Flavobacterium sp. TaxID=165435 RepID=UPI003081B74E